MFTDKRISKVPYWAETVKHVHAIPARVRDARTPAEFDSVIDDACVCYLQHWGEGTRLGITPCGEAIYYSVDDGSDDAILVKEGSKVTGGAK